MSNDAITGLIGAALDQKPLEFKDYFQAAIADRVSDAVDARKTELAASMFNDEEDTGEDLEAGSEDITDEDINSILNDDEDEDEDETAEEE